MFDIHDGAGSTCCCMRDFFGFCFTWACCPLPSATCCEDHEHCCPSNLPICDTAAGRCLASKGTIEGSVPWSTKIPATKVCPPPSRIVCPCLQELMRLCGALRVTSLARVCGGQRRELLTPGIDVYNQTVRLEGPVPLSVRAWLKRWRVPMPVEGYLYMSICYCFLVLCLYPFSRLAFLP